jgi:hypothetical protein
MQGAAQDSSCHTNTYTHSHGTAQVRVASRSFFLVLLAPDSIEHAAISMCSEQVQNSSMKKQPRREQDRFAGSGAYHPARASCASSTISKAALVTPPAAAPWDLISSQRNASKNATAKILMLVRLMGE